MIVNISFLKKVSLFLLRYLAVLAVSALPLCLLFYQKPKSSTIFLAACFVLIIAKRIIIRVGVLARLYAKITTFFSMDPSARLSYAESLAAMALICDVGFEKNPAIIGSMVAVAAVLGLRLLGHFSFGKSPTAEAAVLCLTTVAVFVFVCVKYRYFAGYATTGIIVAAIVISHAAGKNMKYFNKLLVFSLITAMLLNFVVAFVIS